MRILLTRIDSTHRYRKWWQQVVGTEKRSSLRFMIPLLGVIAIMLGGTVSYAQSEANRPQINTPHFDGEITFGERAIFWFGKVTPTDNYADVRVGYNDDVLVIELSIFDRWLWYDETPSPEELTEWDAVTLYLSLNNDFQESLTFNDYQFIAQFDPSNVAEQYLTAYRGGDTGWEPIQQPFSSFVGWRGEGYNDKNKEARGWRVAFIVPFEELGFSKVPASGTEWGMALALHDRDDLSGRAIPDQLWPPVMSSDRPSSWGMLRFGRNDYMPPNSRVAEVITIADGINGVSVVDAHVGGHSTCGDDYAPNFFDGWGEANYADYTQINIQNQSDIADWPCFSKYYITFPLESLPTDRTILSAILTMYQFGNADPSGAKPSLIQVMTVRDTWTEETITWNNAPLAVENVAETWVNVIKDFSSPSNPYNWDVSRGVADSYAIGQPLRLALYSADSDYHSGKYFWSSGTDTAVQPRLRIQLGYRNTQATPSPSRTPIPTATMTPQPELTRTPLPTATSTMQPGTLLPPPKVTTSIYLPSIRDD